MASWTELNIRAARLYSDAMLHNGEARFNAQAGMQTIEPVEEYGDAYVQCETDMKRAAVNLDDPIMETGTSRGGTPLLVACNQFAPNPRMVRFLLALGADPNARYVEGETCYTPLTYVCERIPTSLHPDKLLEVFRILVAHPKIDVNLGVVYGKNGSPGKTVSGDERGKYPLMFAAAACNVEMIQTLLERGADASTKTELGHVAYDYAEHQRSECCGMAEMLHIAATLGESKAAENESFELLGRMHVAEKAMELLRR